jgi:hypothetical protein
MAPIRLTDAQLDAVLAAARPLAVGDRDQFLQDVARALQGQDLGDGAVYRAIREAATMIRRRLITTPRFAAS